MNYGTDLFELEAAVLRQAESMGLEYGSDEFDAFIHKKIVDPEVAMRKAIMPHDQKVAAHFRIEDYIDNMIMRVMERERLRSVLKWCRTNKGESRASALRVFSNDYSIAGSLAIFNKRAAECERLCIGENFSDLLIDGPDYLLEAPAPGELDDGCRGVAPYRQE